MAAPTNKSYSVIAPISPVVPRTGVTDEQPYTDMPGGINGAVSATARTAANTLFPTNKVIDPVTKDVLDGLTPPDGFGGVWANDLDPNTFLSWSTAWQIAYIKRNGNVDYSTTGTGYTLIDSDGSEQNAYLTIGNTHVNATPITVFLGATTDGGNNATTLGRKVYVVENLQKSDIGVMSLKTQERLAQLSAWNDGTNGLALRLGFITGTTTLTGVNTARTGIKSTLDGYIAQMVAVTDGISTDNAAIFSKQITNLKTRLDYSGVFNETDIKSIADAIKDRYDRAAAFAIGANAPTGLKETSIDYYLPSKTISTDGNNTIIQGYTEFMNDEKKRLQIDNSRLSIGKAIADSPYIDLPRLIFLLQLNYQIFSKSISDSDQEELRQQNKYLQDVAVFQRDLQTTLAKFGTGTDEKKKFAGAGNGGVDASTMSAESLRAFSMFETKSTQLQNPIATYRKLPSRPTVELLGDSFTLAGRGTTKFAGFSELSKNKWDAYVTSVNDHVTLVQQQSQVVQNDINNSDKQANRHYDLANNSLTKMYEIMQAVSRS